MMHPISIVILFLFLQMSVMWGLYRILKNPAVVDVSWSIGLMIAGLIYLGLSPVTPRILIIGLLLIVWALRLALYLWYTRIRNGHIDKRYIELSANWKISPSLGFFLNFQLQALLIFVISIVFFLISQSAMTHLNWIDCIALCIVLSGIIGESLADIQVRRFKNQYRGEVCTTGLWGYSRHPNYFFDWLTWMGFALFGIQSKMGYLSLISPLVLYLIFTRMTGPLTERLSVESKGQKYIKYQKQTSMFFPWFKKKIDSE